MGKFYIAILLACFFLTPVSGAHSSELKIVHTDPEWKNGKGDVPLKGRCAYRGGGDDLSPPLRVSEIPENAVFLRLMFTDDYFGQEGGHGNLLLKLSGKQKVIEIPSFSGTSLPKNIIEGNGHHCSGCGSSDYLGPCSGGRYHLYRVNIYALDANKNAISRGTVTLGRF